MEDGTGRDGGMGLQPGTGSRLQASCSFPRAPGLWLLGNGTEGAASGKGQDFLRAVLLLGGVQMQSSSCSGQAVVLPAEDGGF